MEGEFLPPQLLYEGRTERCHPSFKFPEDWDVWHLSNHWSNEDTMLRYLDKVIVPFITKKQAELNLACDHLALAIFDVFRGQRTERFFAALKQQHIEVEFVPANCTDLLQPLDLSINKPFKDQIKSKFVDWYAAQVKKQLEDGVPLEKVKVNTSMSNIKRISANWILSAVDYISNNPCICVTGFRAAGLIRCMC